MPIFVPGLSNQPNRPGGFRVNNKTMEKIIEKIEWVVGWSTKQANTQIRRTTNYFGEKEYNRAYSKYILMSNKDRVVYCYMNRRIQYTDGSVKIERKYSI